MNFITRGFFSFFAQGLLAFSHSVGCNHGREHSTPVGPIEMGDRRVAPDYHTYSPQPTDHYDLKRHKPYNILLVHQLSSPRPIFSPPLSCSHL